MDQRVKQTLSFDERIAQEGEDREVRLVALRRESERLFPGDENRELRKDIERSFSVPQFGEFHNEGMLMDTHLTLMMHTVDDILAGKIHSGVPAAVRDILLTMVSQHEDAVRKYILTHDISKPDSLRLFTGPKKNKVSEDISWEDWTSRVPREVQNDPVALQRWFLENNVTSVSYYHEGQQHGNEGVEKMRRLGALDELPSSVPFMISKHEAAHGFTDNGMPMIKAKTYKKVFGEASSEEEAWVIVASYIDTMASLDKQGEPNTKSFLSMVQSVRNFHIAEVVEATVGTDSRIGKSGFQKSLARLLESPESAPENVTQFLENFFQENILPLYDKPALAKDLEETVTTMNFSPGFQWNAQLTERLLSAVDEKTGRMDMVAFGAIPLTQNQRVVVKEVLSRNRQPAERRALSAMSEAQVFHEASRDRSIGIQQFFQHLDINEKNPEQYPALLYEVFSGPGGREKMQELLDAGILETLLPEFAQSKNLTQDGRFHGNETVGEHLLKILGEMDVRIDQSAPFRDPRMKTLLRTAAFFHDIGKNEEEENSPKVAGKEGRGYRVVTRKANEDFDRVRFLGHAVVGEEIFQTRFAEFQRHVPEGQKLSDAELLTVSLLIRHHMKGVDAVRDIKKFSAQELAEQIVRDLYPVELLNARVPLVDVIRASMMMQETELFAIPASKEREEMVAAWNLIKAQIELMIPVLEAKNTRELLIPLLKGGDLVALDIPRTMIDDIVEDVVYRQEIGEIFDRKSALLYAADLALRRGFAVSQEKIIELAGHGAFQEMRARKENLRVVEEEKRDGYTVRKYETTPIRQFTKETTPADLERGIASGNFPNLAAHVAQYHVPMEKLLELVTERGFANFLQLEFFVKEYCSDGETLLNVGITRSPVMKAVEVNRIMPDGTEASIVVNNGYQGVKSHTGAGIIHMGEQRMVALKEFYAKPGEAEEAIAQRFFNEAVIHVAGTAQLQIPSYYDPERFSTLIAPIEGSNGKQFAGVIIDKQGNTIRAVTTLFQESPKELRLDIRGALRNLKEKQNFTNEQLAPHIENANRLLVSVGEAPLTLEQLERQQQVPVVKEKPKEVVKEKVVVPVALRPLGGMLRQAMAAVVEAFPALVLVKGEKEAFDRMIQEVLREKLHLAEPQIAAVIEAVAKSE